MFEVSSFIKRSPAGRRVWQEVLILLIALFALGINLHFLLARSRDPSAGIAGCGGGGCEAVLSSRWAVVLGVPVTVPGALVWLGVAISLLERFRRFRPVLAGLVAGAAIWFVFVQAVILKSFCPWCMAAHAAGWIAWILTLLCIARDRGCVPALASLGFWTYMGILSIGLAQVYGPLPSTHRISSGPENAAELEKLPVQWRGNGPKVAVFSGFKKLDAGALPHLGPPDAKRVVVEYFDYTCPACRVMSGHFEAFQRKFPDSLCVILLPVPLERSCNRSMPDGEADHAGACEIARLALAVWKHRPDEFPALHRWLMEKERIPAQVRVKVAEVLTQNQIEDAAGNAWIHQLLAANVADWVYFSARQGGGLPKVVGPSRKVLHGQPADREEFFRIIRDFVEL